MHPGTAISLVLALAVILYRVLARSKLTHPLPPGPKPLPIVGNINDLPPPGTPEFQHWIKFKDTYGPISSVTVFGVIMIILNCSEAAHQILTKRSKSTSDKMCAPFGDMMCGFGDLTPNINSGPTHNLHRKFMHQQMGTKKIVEDFHDIHDIESKRLLLRTLNQPSRLLEHIKTATGASILKMTYGYSVEPHQADPLVSLIERTMHSFSTALVPLSWAVDIFPSLKYLPSWLPGMSFKKVARQCRQIVLTTKEIPYDFVKERTFQGHSRPSYVSSLLERLGTKGDEWILDHDDNEAIKNTAAIMFGGGADTSASTIKAFILAMILFPGVQRRAQEEIDSVIGTERLPGFEDREDLPYVSALVTESLRWFPVVPVTPTHVVQEDFVYSGYSIPKGAYLISTAWGSLHDPNTYQNPSQFQPERFLQPRNEPDPRDHSFGYGRRICPGRYFADDSLYLIISRMLATFNITKALDKDGKPLDVELRPVAGLISYPEAFPFSVSPRSAQHNKLLRAIEAADLWDESDAGHLRDHGADGNILV